MKLARLFAIVVLLVVVPEESFAANTSKIMQAKVAPLKVAPVAPISISQLTGAQGDQVSALALTPSAIVIAGTVESTSATSAWVKSSSLGGTDGFIAALDTIGNHLWDIRLGSAQDDVATSIATDKQGNFWVAGVTQGAPMPMPAPAVTPGTIPTINPDNVKVNPVTPPAPALSRLVLWQVSSTGQLLGTYVYESAGAIIPQSLAMTPTGFSVTGRTIVGNNLQGFMIAFDGTKFLTPTFFSQRVTSVAFNRSFAIPRGTIKSFIAMGAIAGIPSWKSKAAIPVIIQYSKNKAIVGASYIHGNIVDMQYQRNIGVVAVTSQSDGYGLYLVVPRP